MRPDIPVCFRYYCVTDNEVVNKLTNPFFKPIGKSMLFTAEELKDTPGAAAKADKIGKKHRPWMHLVRNMVWASKVWNNRRFKTWILDFDPQIIVLQPGDFTYLYQLARTLAKKLQIPLMIHQSEAYYLKDEEEHSLLYKIYRKAYKREFEKTMQYASHCVYLCDALKRDYEQYFTTSGTVIMKPTVLEPRRTEKAFDKQAVSFTYAGNLGPAVGRCEPLVEMGRAIKSLGYHIDVYTASRGDHLSELTEQNGIRMHGAVSYDEVQRILKQSDFVLHMENQSAWHKKEIKYAFSTKIADMLSSGCCSILYGSPDIASIAYFKDNHLGCVIENQAELYDKIKELIDEEALRESYIDAALKQARVFHHLNTNGKQMNAIIRSICEGNT
jgi:glycosyltransferase involved in cell wall biosynthesis